MPDDADAARGSDGTNPERFRVLSNAEYDRVNDLLRDRVSFTAREWAIARLCADFRTETGVEMTKIGEHLPELVPFMNDTYSRKAVYSARRDFDRKVRTAGGTFLYGVSAGFYTPDELDEVLHEATEVATFLAEVEGADLDTPRRLEAEEEVRRAMRAVHDASRELRYDRCPHCGEPMRTE